MKPTPVQQAILLRIANGVPRDLILEDYVSPDVPMHEVASYQHSRDGMTIVAHRTILTQETGNPRLDYRVELFRITREGLVTRL